jgi:hypothetical protein
MMYLTNSEILLHRLAGNCENTMSGLHHANSQLENLMAILKNLVILYPWKVWQDSSDSLECAYGLRYVELNGYGCQKEPWSVRQTAVYHNFKGDNETWIFISPSPLIESKASEHIEQFKEKDIEEVNPFELHLKLVTATLSNYRLYESLLLQLAKGNYRVSLTSR